MPVCTSCGRESADDFAFCPYCATPFVAPQATREQRKVVTVLFCDVTGSTELGERLDPEALRALLARYFEQMKAIVERHGGSVEKFIGDAVMAVFGVPVVHEDDALRALRTAAEMRDALPELGVQGRIGVMTGEVVTGTEERLATGDAVNVAARLQQAAQPGEILIGHDTYGLARDAAEVEVVEPLALKGKAENVAAYRLLSIHGGEPFARRLDAPMIGRERERRMLADAWERVVSERSCHLFTVLGAAGVGKSRLAAEFLAAPDGGLVVRGRCLPYGEGITYWPVVEVVKQLPEAELEPGTAAAIRAVAGEGTAVTSSEEIAWSFRRLLEVVAADTPVVCVFDDVHWGEETFLDLIEHVADLSRDAPILLLCMARPDLLDRRPGWAGGKVNATNVLLEPLVAAEADLLIDSLAPLEDGLRVRIREAAEGNPLFVEEMVAMVRDSSGGEIVVPPTIQALLSARIDQLDASERSVLERGAVEGRIFHRGAVQALAPDEPQVGARLTSLVRKELVRPDKGQLPGEEAFRFRHLLIRDAAYDALPKSTRAELHERFAAWLEEHGTGLVELDEILGYHLEQSARYRVELGSPDETAALRASDRLASAARRAELRGDMNAATNLLERAVQLRSGFVSDVVLEIDLGHALFSSGRVAEAEAHLRDTATRAEAGGDPDAALLARLAHTGMTAYTDLSVTSADLLAQGETAVSVFEAAGNDRGLMEAWHLVGQAHHALCHFGSRNDAFVRVIEYARRCGDEYSASHFTAQLGPGYVFGPSPVEEAIAWHESARASASVRPGLLGLLAMLEAMHRRFDVARKLLAENDARLADLGPHVTSAHAGEYAFHIETRSGEPERAEDVLRRSCEELERMGERGWLSTQAGELGYVLCSLGRYDEAHDWARKSAELGQKDDIITQMYWRQVEARVCAHRGEVVRAEELAREAVQYGEQTDMLSPRGLSQLDLAEVLELAGNRIEAAEQAREALRLFEQKGDLAMVDQAQARLERLL
jgi:class 3 adenylate cyclase/tetratricopeptide (TPR) repeat protein